MNCQLHGVNLLASIGEMDKMYSKAGFNDEPKYGLLRNSVTFSDNFRRTEKTMKDLAAGFHAFKATKSATQSV